MRRPAVAFLVIGALAAASIGIGPGGGYEGIARAADADGAKEAFTAAKELGTVEAWDAFLASYPDGFYADLARAYLKKLGGGSGEAASPPAEDAAPADDAAADEAASPPAEDAAPADVAAGDDIPEDVGVPPTDPAKPAIARGASFMGFPEKFNRYYTDPKWKPSRTVYVSPHGGGDGESRDSPASAADAIAGATPGTQITFLAGEYEGCYELNKDNGGTYDQPVVLYGERKKDKSIAVKVNCCSSGRHTCFNLETADYVAVDGFELAGGKYGVRAVGADYAASQHSRGNAVMNCRGHDQDRDPFFTGHSDWFVIERNVAWGAKKGDGHGIYLSNGGDWNIVRFNETFSNASSDFQINADPASTCAEPGIPFDDPRCDAYAGTGEGGQGASDYFLVDGNYFHHGDFNGPNFTSVRRSLVRNNVFGPQARHNVSFWQETDNPKLGSSENKIVHNLFITTDKHGVQFSVNSDRNLFANNVLLGISVKGGKAMANPKALLMEVDDTVGSNVYRGNFYVSGRIDGREPNDEETVEAEFSPAWFAKFPAALNHNANDYKPTADAPFLDAGGLLESAPADRNGTKRSDPADLGPIEVD